MLRLSSLCLAVLCSLSSVVSSTQGAPLATIRERGFWHVCAHPDALPFSSQDRTQPGLQLEIAEAIAKELGVRLQVAWIIYTYHARRAECDATIGVVIPRDRQEGGQPRGQQLTKPYVGGGYVLAVPRDAAAVQRLEDLQGKAIGVQHTSWPHYVLDTRGLPTLSYGNQLDILEAVAQGKVAAGFVSNAYVGWYLKQHPAGAVKVAAEFVPNTEFQWNVAVGLRQADEALVTAVNQALDHLLANETIQQIFARYGVTYVPPFPS